MWGSQVITQPLPKNADCKAVVLDAALSPFHHPAQGSFASCCAQARATTVLMSPACLQVPRSSHCIFFKCRCVAGYCSLDLCLWLFGCLPKARRVLCSRRLLERRREQQTLVQPRLACTRPHTHRDQVPSQRPTKRTQLTTPSHKNITVLAKTSRQVFLAEKSLISQSCTCAAHLHKSFMLQLQPQTDIHSIHNNLSHSTTWPEWVAYR